MVVQTSTSNRFSQKSSTTCSSLCSPIFPCATAMRASGTSSRMRAAAFSIVDTLLCTKKTWPSRSQLAPDRRGQRLLVVGPDVGEHRVALLRRGLQGRHLADAGDRHLERARDRRGRHREHVDRGAQRLELLLVLDAEALLLVDDDQPEVLEPHLLAQDAVGADHHVDRAVGQPVEHRLGLAVALEPRQRPHDDGEAGIALGEGVGVLLHEQRGRAQDGHLLAVLDRLEGRPHRDLGLAVADVAADEAVHRHRALHVGLDLVDGAQLVGGLDVGERVFELALPRGVGREGVAGGGHPCGVEADQLGRDLLDVALGPALGLVPVGAAHLVERGLLAADVAGDLVELVGGHVEPVAGVAALARGVLEHEVLTRRAGDGALHHLDELADAVLLVHDEVAGAQLEGVDLVAATRRHPPHVLGRRAGAARRAGEVGLGDHGQPRGRGQEARTDRAGGDGDDPGRGVGVVGDEPARHVVLGEHLGDALGQAGALGGDEHRPVAGDEPAQLGDGLVGVAAEGGGDLEAEVEGVALVVTGERREVEPAHPELAGLLAQLGQGAERRGAEHRREVDRHARCRWRRWPSRRRGTPGWWR